jgi:hypothetical protein
VHGALEEGRAVLEDRRMTSHRAAPLPTDLAWPDLSLDDLSFYVDEGVYGEVRDASKCTRGQAIAFFASEAGCAFTDVRCVVRYVLLHTRQDVWDGPGRDRWADDWAFDNHVRVVWHEDRKGQPDEWTYEYLNGEPATPPELPAEPPPDWRPDEGMPCWSTCRPDHPRAQRAYMLEIKGENRIPDTPKGS